LVSAKLLFPVFGLGALLLLASIWSGQVMHVMLVGAWAGAEALVDGTWFGVIAFLLGCVLILVAAGMAVASVRRHGEANRFCMQCGAGNPATDEFCGRCGKKLAPMI
jgi:ribosomal protein L40E